jgi:SOS-response transcriptional repressor LexA
MWIVGVRLDEAIQASGKTQKQVSDETGIAEKTISQIINGAHRNPSLDLLERLAAATNTTVAVLVGGTFVISPPDEAELVRHRGWIDEKLRTVDARLEPNAVIEEQRDLASTKETRVADRKLSAMGANLFNAQITLVLRAIGDSMRDAGIVEEDQLYAIAPPRSRDALIGRIVACRLDDAIFVKRYVVEHQRAYLVSAHPRYRSIEAGDTLDVLGVVIGKSGRLA